MSSSEHYYSAIISLSSRFPENRKESVIRRNVILCRRCSQPKNCSVIIISDSRLVSLLELLTTSNRSALFSFLWQAHRLDDLKKLRKCQDTTSWRFRDFHSLDVFVFNYQLMSKYLRETIKSSRERERENTLLIHPAVNSFNER